MGSTCSLPPIVLPFIHTFSVQKSNPSEPTVETIERLITRDRQSTKNVGLNKLNVTDKKFLVPSDNHMKDKRPIKSSGSNESSKVYTFKEYKQYLQSRRESKTISTPVTSITEKKETNNERCRTATIRKINKDDKTNSTSTSTSSSPLSSSSSSSPPLTLSVISSNSISNQSESKKSSSAVINSVKKVTWQKTDRKSSFSDKESSDDSGIGGLSTTLEQASKSKRRIRPTADTNHKKCNWPTA
ncbi:uncharacterized protein DDB_G0271670-like [Tetranychus urticae]|uniref:uncharacterized protein DDB_G0271670-like n=1 Tax=Tetranychus urticae TaxID=32264 RepID=UPI00077BE2FA|nr:uncharacterized protein DDB_G0271670-like [Tetranychus urticae]